MDQMKIVGLILAVLSILSLLEKVLGFIKDKTASQVDNRAFDFIAKVMAFGQKVLDFMGYNPSHIIPEQKDSQSQPEQK